jgi:hypothetical protein
MLATCRNGGVGLAIAHEGGGRVVITHERRGGGWQSLMREGSEDGEKLFSNGSRSDYIESDEGGDAATLPKKSLAFG